jgi:hypothetical protein
MADSAFLAGKIEHLRNDISIILEEMKPFIESAARFRWDPSTMGYLPLIRRAILCRQYECFGCILQLVEHSQGYAGLPLLRPACEELIWAKYLALIDKDSANDLLLCLTQKGMFDSLVAQDHYAGRTQTKKSDLLEILKRLTLHQPAVRSELSAIGKKLNWPKKSIEARTTPSMEWLAKTTEMRWVYDYLYHASSRYVHFSPTELLRRAWGTPEEVTIQSSNYGDYWNAFVLVWGQKLITEVFLVLQKSLEADGVIDVEVDGDKIIGAYKRIAEFGLVPIITQSELNWPR